MLDKASISLAELLAPMSEDEFFGKYYGKRWLHIEAKGKQAGRRAELFDWGGLNAMLDMALIWSDKNFHVVLDKKMISANQYCLPQVDRNHAEAKVPNQDLVMQFLNKGASVVLDDVDGLNGGLRCISRVLQEAFSSKVQANLYCSWKQRQAFDVHYDTHDVFAVHFAGEKVWNIYETCVNNPVHHQSFLHSSAVHAEQCGKVKQQVRMRAGDILYLPKGQYHDALATEDNALHVAFGIHGFLGLDFARLLSDSLVYDELFRKPLPLPSEGDEAFAEYMRKLGDKMASLVRTPEMLAEVRKAQSQHRYPQHVYGLPLDNAKIEAKPSESYRLGKGDFQVVEQKGQMLLVNAGRAVPLPADIAKPVAWIIARKTFTSDELQAEFFAKSPPSASKLIGDLLNMGVIVKD